MKTKRPEAAELFPMIYGELRRVAGRYLSRERRNHTLQPTALVHEAWLRLARQGERQRLARGEFLGAAAGAMRFVLVDHAPLALAERAELLEGFVERQQVDSVPEIARGIRQRDALVCAAALLRARAPRMVDEHAPDGLRRDREEVRPPLPIRALLVDEPHVGLVHERRGLQRVVRPLLTQAALGDRVQLSVQEPHELVHRRVIAVSRAIERVAGKGSFRHLLIRL